MIEAVIRAVWPFSFTRFHSEKIGQAESKTPKIWVSVRLVSSGSHR